MPLLLVLWVGALLALIGVSLLSSATTSLKLAKNAIQQAQSEAIAQAAVERAVHEMVFGRADGEVPEKSARFTFRDTALTVGIQDEIGRIDLNFADRELLLGLTRSGGVRGEEANRIVDGVVDWRSRAPDSGSESGRGLRNRDGTAFRVRHGMFQSVDELALVPGVTSDLFARIEEALTLHSQRQMVDPLLASPKVLVALPRLMQEQATRNGQQVLTNPAEGAYDARLGRAFSLRVQLRRGEGQRSYQAVIRLAGSDERLFWLLSWTEVLID